MFSSVCTLNIPACFLLLPFQGQDGPPGDKGDDGEPGQTVSNWMEGICVQSPQCLCAGPRALTQKDVQQLTTSTFPCCVPHPILSRLCQPGYCHPSRLLSNASKKQNLAYKKNQNLAFRFKLAMPYGITWWEGIKQDTTCTPRKCWELYWPPTPRLSTNSKSQLEFCTLAPASYVSWCSHGFSSTLHLGFPRSHGRARTLRTPRKKGKLIV